jgi:hypothetical protein
MTRDPVPNVRLRLVRFFPALAVKWKRSVEFAEALRTLTSDSDRQVALEARGLLKALPHLPGLSSEKLDLDRKLEAAEASFFVHKKKKTAAGGEGTSGTPSAAGARGNDGRGNGAVAKAQNGSNGVSSPHQGSTTPAARLPVQDSAGGLTNGAAPLKQGGSGAAPAGRDNGNAVKKAFCGCFGGG